MLIRSILFRYASSAVAAAILSACSLLPLTPTPPGPIPADFQVMVDREACFGTCPVYKMAVLADGAVAFEGIMFVAAEGNRTAKLTSEELRGLVNAVVEADFFRLADRYEFQATDLPSITVTVTMNGRTKSVYHYGLACGSDMDNAPASLCELEALLEGVPVANGWVSAP